MDDLLSVREHIAELKRKFLYVVVFSVFLFFVGFIFSSFFIDFILEFYGLSAVVASPTGYIGAQLSVALYVTLACLIPFLLVQVYLFSKPLVVDNFRIRVVSIFFKALFLALLGAFFGFFIFSKLSLEFFSRLPENIVQLWTVNSIIKYVSFSVFAFALTAQIIIIIPLLVRLDLVNLKTFKKSRGTVIMVILALAAIVTPPDPWTQVWMALPMYLCFEAGIVLSYFNKKEKNLDLEEKK